MISFITYYTFLGATNDGQLQQPRHDQPQPTAMSQQPKPQDDSDDNECETTDDIGEGIGYSGKRIG